VLIYFFKAFLKGPYLRPQTKWFIIMDLRISSLKTLSEVKITAELAKPKCLPSFWEKILELVRLS